MSSYVGGPYDDKRFNTRFDDLPVIHLEHYEIVDGKLVRMVASYELKCGMRVYKGSQPHADLDAKVK